MQTWLHLQNISKDTGSPNIVVCVIITDSDHDIGNFQRFVDMMFNTGPKSKKSKTILELLRISFWLNFGQSYVKFQFVISREKWMLYSMIFKMFIILHN